jgi:ketosteroid isomerase-like protein
MNTLGDEHLALVKRLLSAFATSNWAVVRELMTEDVLMHFPGSGPFAGSYRGKAAALDLLARIAAHTEGSARVKMHDVLANDQHAVLLYQVSAKHGDSSISYRYVDIYHFRDGQVSEVWGMADNQVAFDAFYSA